MNLPKTLLLILILVLNFFQYSFGNLEYVIKFRIKGLKDTTCMIATYYGNGTYIKDTLKVDGSGKFTYRPPNDIPRGIYIVVINEKTYFDFILDKDIKFSMETDLSDLNGKMVLSGTPENSLFYDYLDFNRKKFVEIQAIQSKRKQFNEDKDSIRLIDERISSINSEMIKFKLELIDKYPESFVAFFIKAMREPEVPEAPILSNGRKDSTFARRYYMDHFWDGTDFTDERLLHTPVFHNKLKKYFEKVVPQNPDSIIRYSDIMVDKARKNKEMFKYLVWFLTYTYENSDIMGFDKVFVHVVDRYYVTNEATWVTPAVMENIVKKSNRIKPLLLGEIAPNMIMMDTLSKLVSMHSISAEYLILLFWDPDCGHCEEEIPKLKEFYDRQKDSLGIKIFTVCSDTSLVKWKSSVIKRQMNWINVNGPRTLTGNYHDQYDISTTPVIYILDRKKMIIAKKLSVEQIMPFLQNYRKMIKN